MFDAARLRSLPGKELFLYWVQAREAIRKARKNGAPPPWTDDPILQKYRFTNVRRRHDRVSRWLLRNWYPVTFLHGMPDWYAGVLARIYNWPPALRAMVVDGVLHKWHEPSTFLHALEQSVLARAEQGERCYNSCYIVPPGTGPRDRGRPKVSTHINHMLGPLLADRKVLDAAFSGSRLRPAAVALTDYTGIGEFLAGQVVADMTYLRGHPLAEATDLYFWAPRGPGAMRGLNYIYHGQLKDKIWAEKDYLVALLGLLTLLHEEPAYRDLTLHDVQNCCCEISKYAKALHEQGRPKTLYHPTTEF